MWKVYKWNGSYIQGDLLSKHSSESAALKAAKKAIKFIKTEKKKKKKAKQKEYIDLSLVDEVLELLIERGVTL